MKRSTPPARTPTPTPNPAGMTSAARLGDPSGFLRSTTEKTRPFSSSATNPVPPPPLTPTPWIRFPRWTIAWAISMQPRWRPGNKSLGLDPLGRPIIQNSIYDPLSQGPVSASDSRLIRNPFPGNVIPITQLDPVALKIQALVPKPQGPNATQLINNYNSPF